jgi:hypothetical protein
MADLLDDLSWERRILLPSMAITCPAVTIHTDCIQLKKHSSNSVDGNTENILPKVS